MSKRIRAGELASIVTVLLTTPPMYETSSGYETQQAFMTEIAKLLCKFAGGEVRNDAALTDDILYVGIHGDDILPKDGGVWKAFDTEGQLWDEEESTVVDSVHSSIVLPHEVRLAVDRMCFPLDKSRLDGATAEADAQCMAAIKSFVDMFAQPTTVAEAVAKYEP